MNSYMTVLIYDGRFLGVLLPGFVLLVILKSLLLEAAIENSVSKDLVTEYLVSKDLV